ncbi:hypothetical protein BSKO_12990 [Bryopsis sp. KO-2023]|nr:hypothetical protein BSKO_12990 [Bryopsis sp. KO-2023]
MYGLAPDLREGMSLADDRDLTARGEGSERDWSAMTSVCGGDEVVFDVGGRRFSTTLKTLRRYPDSLLCGVCEDCPDAMGGGKPIRIDRSPEGFEWILAIYRGPSRLHRIPRSWTIEDARNELDYYQLPKAEDLNLLLHSSWIKLTEVGIAKKIAHEILAEISKSRNELILRSSVGFLVWFREEDRSQFHVTMVNKEVDKGYARDVKTELSRLSTPDSLQLFDATAKMRFRGVELRNGCIFPHLTQDFLRPIMETLGDFGFGVESRVVTICGAVAPKDVEIPFLGVTW